MSGMDPHKEREPAQPRQPGLEYRMHEKPLVIRDSYRGSGKLEGRTALITGGDSGIGRSVAVHFAREGADVAVAYLCEDTDAGETRAMVEKEGRRCLLSRGDVGDPAYCRKLVDEVFEAFGKLDILVNNAAEQHSVSSLEEVTEEQLLATFRTNLFGYFHMMKEVLGRLPEGGRIINSSSVTAHRGSKHLIDYAGTKGAIESLTRSVAQLAAKRGVNVNCVAPGPIWTPLIPASFEQEHLPDFGKDTLLGRPGQPCEAATCYVFLASEDSSYITGQTLHPNGGGHFPY